MKKTDMSLLQDYYEKEFSTPDMEPWDMLTESQKKILKEETGFGLYVLSKNLEETLRLSKLKMLEFYKLFYEMGECAAKAAEGMRNLKEKNNK